MLSILRRRGFLLAGIGIAALFLAGCTDEPVRVYELPRQKQRLLAAIIPLENETWFFKLMGDYDPTTQNAEAFWKFVRSVRFPKDVSEPITWTAPAEWKQELGSELRYATFRIPQGQEATVFKFGPQPKLVIDNVNRWRKQLKLPPMSQADFEQIKHESIDGNPSLLIDLESARTDAIDVELFETNARAKKADEGQDQQAPEVPEYKAPAGWKEIPRAGRMFFVGFQVEEGGASAEITLTPLPRRAGDTAGNVNRWRGELGLPELPASEAEKDGQTVDVDGVKSVSVDYSGIHSKTSKPTRTLAVICVRKNTAWFVKMMGPPELVGKQKSAFESFVRSIRFGGGK